MKIRLIIALVLLLSSCSSYKIGVEETVKVSNYDMYVFRLCEKTNKLGNDRFYLCDEDCKSIKREVYKTKATIVTEELYLMVSRTTDDVIYLTTKINRSFDSTPDIFNTEAHEDYVLVDDLENVYFGKKTKESLNFVSKNENLTLFIAPESKSCKITITSILSEGKVAKSIKNKKIEINEIYNVAVDFNLTNRTLVLKNKQSSNFEAIDNIQLTKHKVRFNGVLSFIEGSKRRLKFHPNFDK